MQYITLLYDIQFIVQRYHIVYCVLRYLSVCMCTCHKASQSSQSPVHTAKALTNRIYLLPSSCYKLFRTITIFPPLNPWLWPDVESGVGLNPVSVFNRPHRRRLFHLVGRAQISKCDSRKTIAVSFRLAIRVFATSPAGCFMPYYYTVTECLRDICASTVQTRVNRIALKNNCESVSSFMSVIKNCITLGRWHVDNNI